MYTCMQCMCMYSTDQRQGKCVLTGIAPRTNHGLYTGQTRSVRGPTAFSAKPYCGQHQGLPRLIQATSAVMVKQAARKGEGKDSSVEPQCKFSVQ